MAFIALLPCFAQRPPTSGPNPPESSGISPILLIGGGAAIGTASLLHFRSRRGVKLPISERLPTYLLSRNYLPTIDALNLIYWLNPELDSNEYIKATKKLVLPSFPVMEEKTSDENDFFEVMVDYQLLKEKNEEIYTTYLGFSQLDTGALFDYGVSDKVHSSMHKLKELDLIKFLEDQKENIVLQQIVFDLLIALDDVLEEVSEVKDEPEQSVAFMQAIIDNLSEIITDFRSLSWEPSLETDMVNDPHKLLASASQFAGMDSRSERSGINEIMRNPKFKGFAFAIYKRNEDGQIITKGPEVEGRYFLKYVVPALRDIPQAYHSLNGPATYATGLFPPAKLHIAVEDINGSQVQLQNHVIDFKTVFENPQYGRFEEFTIVPLFIPQ